MRKSILERIEQIKISEENFNKLSVRWKDFIIAGKHISEIDFNILDDNQLVSMFESVLFKYYKQI